MFHQDKLLKKMLAGASVSLVIRVCGVVLMFATHVILARSMGDHDYAIFVYAFSIIPILALIATSGFQMSSLRFLKEYDQGDQTELKTGFMRRSFQIALLISAILFIVATGAGFLFDNLPETVRESARYASWIIIFYSLAAVAQQALRVMKRIAYSQIFEQLCVPLILILVAAYFLLSREPLGYGLAFSVYGIAYLGVVVVGWILAFKFLGINLGAPYRYQTAHWVSVSFPLCLVGLGVLLMTRIDIIILGFMVDAESVALYSVSGRIAALSVFCMAAVNAITGPYASEYYHANKMLELKLLLQRVVFFTTLMNLSFWLFLLGFGEYLLLAFGQQYVAMKDLLLILAAGRLSGVGLSIVGPVLNVSGHQKVYLYLLILMSLLLLAALFYSVPRYGLMGAAIATTSVMVITNTLLFILVKKYLGINLFNRN